MVASLTVVAVSLLPLYHVEWHVSKARLLLWLRKQAVAHPAVYNSIYAVLEELSIEEKLEKL